MVCKNSETLALVGIASKFWCLLYFQVNYLVQLIEPPIFQIPNYELYWHFWVYFDNNLKIIAGENTQKVSKQKIRDS